MQDSNPVLQDKQNVLSQSRAGIEKEIELILIFHSELGIKNNHANQFFILRDSPCKFDLRKGICNNDKTMALKFI